MTDAEWQQGVVDTLHMIRRGAFRGSVEDYEAYVSRLLAAAGAKIVPTETTQTMWDAAGKSAGRGDGWDEMWRTAIAASPDISA